MVASSGHRVGAGCGAVAGVCLAVSAGLRSVVAVGCAVGSAGVWSVVCVPGSVVTVATAGGRLC